MFLQAAVNISTLAACSSWFWFILSGFEEFIVQNCCNGVQDEKWNPGKSYNGGPLRKSPCNSTKLVLNVCFKHRCQWRLTCLLFLHQSCPIFETHELLPCGSDVMLRQCLMSRHGRQEPLYCSPAHTSLLKQKQEHSHQMSHLPTLVPLLNHEIKNLKAKLVLKLKAEQQGKNIIFFWRQKCLCAFPVLKKLQRKIWILSYIITVNTYNINVHIL